LKVREGLTVLIAVATCAIGAFAQRRPTFRSDVTTIYVNVIVRDASGNVVRGLTPGDFTLLEDDKPQTISTFDFEEVPADPAVRTTDLRDRETLPILKPSPASESAQKVDLSDRRLVVLLFDLASMQPEEIERAVASAREYIERRLTTADLVALASVGSTLQVDRDFTANREALLRGLDRYTGIEAVDEGVAPDAEPEPESFAPDETEFNIFNTDRRLRAIETLADAIAPIQQKKSIVYFSSGMSRTGVDNQVQLRAAIDRAVKANVSIYPVDTRGLTAVVPGGDARQASRGGTDMFSGRGLAGSFDRQAATQETLVTLASDTGGRAFLDTNDFGPVYTRVIADTSAYYLLGYNSTNPARDGRFRRIRVRVIPSTSLGAGKRALKIEHRSGYYADRDFTHSTREGRERQLEEQLLADLSSTDLTVWLSTAYFRMEGNRFYVPLSVAVPGSEIPTGAGDRASLDVLGVVFDQDRRPVARVRDTVKLGAQQTRDVRRKAVQYESGFTLPAGKYRMKVVVRENQIGTIGTFETDIVVPDLRTAPVKMSSVVLGTQLQPASGRVSENPLVRDGARLVPSLTHVVSKMQPLYFYYEVYEPGTTPGGGPRLLTSIAFFRGLARTYETPLVEMTRVESAARRAAVFQFSVPASALEPGFYTCQINVVDDVAGTFTFPRLALLVKP
jgi:VWFA-related protein